ncbi:MAG: FxsA family protein [Gammaproteobacteria bacterium]
MFSILLLAFIAVPVVEIYLFIEVGGLIGAGWTVAVVILTAILGASLLRQQGLSTLMRARRQMDQAQIPAQEMVEGLVLVFCGGLLLTPGFFTDTVGFLLLLPGLRARIARSIMDRAVVVGGSAGQRHAGFGPTSRRGRGDTIEGEFRRDD